ncbi:MAG: hypothetical protein ACK4SX_06730 [Alcanivoracaceae bacterium]
MNKIKGPAISEDTFKVSGHCCGVRFDHIGADQGFPFELTPEARKQLEAQGVSLPPQAPPHDEQSADLGTKLAQDAPVGDETDSDQP